MADPRQENDMSQPDVGASARPPDDVDFASLTPKQREVLGLIAMNQDEGHHPKTLAILESLGLIVGREEILGGGIPVSVNR